MIISWGPNMIIFPLFEADVVPLLYFDISLVMGTLNGVLCGLLFLYKSKEVHHLWYNLIFCRKSGDNQAEQLLSSASRGSSSQSFTLQKKNNNGRANFSSYGKEDRESHYSGWEKDQSRFLSVDPSRDTTASDIEFIVRPRASIFDYEPGSTPNNNNN